MFTFNLTSVLSFVIPKRKKLNKSNSKQFEPLFDTRYEPPSPGEIRQALKNLAKCPKCHFIVFDNYWTNDIDHPNMKVCSTCGSKV